MIFLTFALAKTSAARYFSPAAGFAVSPMFERLQKKWKVSPTRLLLIICTFAIGGSLTGYAARKLINYLPVDRGALWVLIYIVLVTLLWPVAVLLISVFFGQYAFFAAYLKKMGRRMRLIKSTKLKRTNIAIFASGAGSNAEKIIAHFRNSTTISIRLIVCNKPGAGVLDIADRNNIPSLLIEKERFFRGDGYVQELKDAGIDFIVLAGFLWKIPDTILVAYPGKIVNIHPALLPRYGGKGMYGQFVHAAVIAAGDTESGITIHYVDGKYDNGDIIFQASCPVLPTDTAATLAMRIHQLEHEHYPRVIAGIAKSG